MLNPRGGASVVPKDEERYRQEFRGLSKMGKRDNIYKSPTLYEDPREFGRRVAVELFQESVEVSDDQEPSGSETD